MPLVTEGTHVRGFAETAADDSSVSRFTSRVWPLVNGEMTQLDTRTLQ